MSSRSRRPAPLRALPGLLLSRGAPVRLRLHADWRQWWRQGDWSLRFLRACRAGTSQQGTATLLALARLSRQVLAGWLREEAWQVGHAQNGKLVLCPDAATLARQRAQLRVQASLGCRQELLSPAECREREPSLGPALERMAGGVWTADECVADPWLLCRELAAGVQRRGGTLRFGTRVEGWVREGSRLVAARSSQGELRADAFVLAAGPQAAALAATLGLHLPICPIKGYSLTLPFRGARRPTASVTDLGRKTVFAPLGDRLRVAAMAEIGDDTLEIPPARVQQMLAAVQALYPGLCALDAPQAWAGLRPATPDSVPLIGRAGADNLFLNLGHGALGLTLAAGSAARLSSALSTAFKQASPPVPLAEHPPSQEQYPC